MRRLSHFAWLWLSLLSFVVLILVRTGTRLHHSHSHVSVCAKMGQHTMCSFGSHCFQLQRSDGIKQIGDMGQMLSATSVKGKTGTTESLNSSWTPRIEDFEDQFCFSFTTNKPFACSPEEGEGLSLLMMVTSAVTHFQARQAVRSTWGSSAMSRGVRLLFLLGRSDNETLQTLILEEDSVHQDLVQVNFIDSYQNLTLKSIALMKWVALFCNQAKFVLKVDDDMLVNVDNLMAFIDTSNFTRTIIGKLAHRWKPHRNVTNKWYVPKDVFPKSVYPDFVTGPAYLFTPDSATRLYTTSLSFPFFYLEDVFLTGIVAQQAKVRRCSHPGITNRLQRIDVCSFRTLMTSHKHQPEDVIRLWNKVSGSQEICVNGTLTTKDTIASLSPVMALLPH